MPRRKSSVKRTRADKKKYLRNLRITRKLKTVLKDFQKLVAAKKNDEAKKFLMDVFSQLDKAAKKNIIHPNRVNRTKSRLSRKLS
ncbi:MAG: 30S ribosomal protein S20 [Candidatus Omnitrophica bacterium]|jgi:small subunit ribosomal protein S20|nr:30S ribosomal protein S20 [Candidatus Omnitrophota bacterium]